MFGQIFELVKFEAICKTYDLVRNHHFINKVNNRIVCLQNIKHSLGLGE
jgi:hypothetical protein